MPTGRRNPPSGAALIVRLQSALAPWVDAPAWRVALSGGLDSTVLLHALVQLRQTTSIPPLRAIHVNHQLQPAASEWARHCQALCQHWSVPLEVVAVDVADGASLEAQARQARQRAFVDVLKPGELLITAQHRDDQIETLLFRLFRGAGVRGLGGMPAQRALGAGWLVRPLLQLPRSALEEYASVRALDWVDDPSNSDLRFSRNWLRHVLLPLVARRWPGAAMSMSRVADNLREADALLTELAEQDLHLAAAGDPLPWLGVPNLALAPLLAMSPARQRNALRRWLAPVARLPDRDHWAGWDALRDARPDAQPRWSLADGELQRAGGRIWFVAPSWQRVPSGVSWSEAGSRMVLPDNGYVELTEPWGGRDYQVRYRAGGERLSLDGQGRRDLKKLLNEQGWPSFLRARVPLLFRDNELVAVANLIPRLDGGPVFRWVPPQPAAGLSW